MGGKVEGRGKARFAQGSLHQKFLSLLMSLLLLCVLHIAISGRYLGIIILLS